MYVFIYVQQLCENVFVYDAIVWKCFCVDSPPSPGLTYPGTYIETETHTCMYIWVFPKNGDTPKRPKWWFWGSTILGNPWISCQCEYPNLGRKRNGSTQGLRSEPQLGEQEQPTRNAQSCVCFLFCISVNCSNVTVLHAWKSQQFRRTSRFFYNYKNRMKPQQQCTPCVEIRNS